MKRPEIEALTGLRGIAAFWVFAFHVSDWFRRIGTDAADGAALLGGAGYLGVDIFFVLSGFVLAFNYASDDLHRSPRYFSFLWKRLARIYPVHLFALALLVILQLAFAAFGIGLFPRSWFTPGGLIDTLALTHGWAMPIPKVWNLVSWSISCEWAAYLLFPLVAVGARRFQTRRQIILAVILVFLALAYVISVTGHKGTLAYGMPRIAAEFSAGVLLHRLWELRGFESLRAHDHTAALALAVLIIGGNVMAISMGHSAPLLFLPVLACLVVYGLAAGSGGLGRVLSTPAALWAGRVSYAFYMVHLLVINAISASLGRQTMLDEAGPAIAAAVTALLLSAALAHWVHRAIEVPARRGMIRLSQRGFIGHAQSRHLT